MIKKPDGFVQLSHIFVISGVLAVTGLAGYKVINNLAKPYPWNFNGHEWVAKGIAPVCPSPVLQPPVDTADVTAVLYPGQSRGGQYNTQGGFRLDGQTTNNVSIDAPMDSVLIRGSRYIEQGEVQNQLVFMAPCGIMYSFDHLATLSTKFQNAVDVSLPAAKNGDLTLHDIKPQISVDGGEVVATAVGFNNPLSVSFDFGVYDLRQPNTASADPVFELAHANDKNKGETDFGVCWFDYLPSGAGSYLRSLPSGNQTSGKNSDYCK